MGSYFCTSNLNFEYLILVKSFYRFLANSNTVRSSSALVYMAAEGFCWFFFIIFWFPAFSPYFKSGSFCSVCCKSLLQCGACESAIQRYTLFIWKSPTCSGWRHIFVGEKGLRKCIWDHFYRSVSEMQIRAYWRLRVCKERLDEVFVLLLTSRHNIRCLGCVF